MNASPWRLQWPERADTVEQRRPWRVRCVYTPWKLAGRGLRWKGRNVTPSHAPDPPFPKLAHNRSLNCPTPPPRPSHFYFSLKTTMVVSAVTLITDPTEEFRSDSLETTVIDQSRPRERYQAPTHRRL